MISRTVKYALRILGYLADHPGRWIPGEQIARDTRIPANYLSKILNQLRKGGFVRSRKGWGGGFLMEESAKARPVFHVVELLDGPLRTDECVFGLGRCNRENPCPLHSRWEKISGAFERMVREVTVADLQAAGRRDP